MMKFTMLLTIAEIILAFITVLHGWAASRLTLGFGGVTLTY